MMIERKSLSSTKTTQCQMAITKIIIKTNDNGIRTSKHSNGHHPHHLFHLIFFLWLISIQSIVVVVVDCYSISNPTFDSEIVIVDGRRQNQAQSKSLSSSSSSPQSSSSSSSSATTIPTTIASTIQSSNHPNYNYYFTSNNHQHNDGSNNNHGNHDGNNGGNNGGGEHQELPPRRFQVAKFDFEHVSTPYIILLWIIIVGLAKMGFHVTPKLSSICPESVVLMILGVIIGLIMYFAGIPEERLQPLTPNLFFLYMLPPIVMDAGYHMPNRLFFDNLVSILLYAVVGTIWNTLAIGFSLYGCSQLGVFGEEIPFLDIMLFSSTVSAVDPVAVLAVFEEIHVNEVLYILVFGESLLNDGVTVVLYHMFEGYAEMTYHYGVDSIQTIDLLAGVASFFVVAIGGTAMGIFWGFLAAFVSRFTHHVKIIEPIFVFVMAYLSYLSAEMFHLSGILSLTFCGLTMKNYVEENITQKSHTTLKYAMKMLANSSEAIIFVFLGVCTVNDQHHWNTAFVALTIIFCLVYRTIGVLVLTTLTNRYRLHQVNRVEQFIMSYGGLRGAVAFALILIINRQIIHAREMMVTTIIAVVYFTVFLQGMTVGTLVKILNVPRANKFELTMNERIHTRLMDHVMAGLEDISGMMMGNYKLRDKFRYYNNKYLRKWLLRDSKEMGNSSRKIFETCSRLDLRDAMSLVSRQHLMATSAGAATVTMNGDSASGKRLEFAAASAAYSNANYVVDDDDDDDFKNNNIINKKKKKPRNIPRVFLTVPGNPALATSGITPIVVDPNQSLQTLLRSFTQSNLAALYQEDSGMKYQPTNPTTTPSTNNSTPNSSFESNYDNGDYFISSNEEVIKSKQQLQQPNSLDFNYDIGTVVYSPSLKDLKDAELHHILSDAMFKPFKKAHHYTRSDYYEEPISHPPFQHQVRMQIRRLISEKETQQQQHRRHQHRRHTHHSSYHHSSQRDKKIKSKNQHQNNDNVDGGDNEKLEQIEMKSSNKSKNHHHHKHRSNSSKKSNLKRSKSENEIDNFDDSDNNENSDEKNYSKTTKNNNNNKNNADDNDADVDDDDDDGGITFVAKKLPNNDDDDKANEKSSPSLPLATTIMMTKPMNFPWRRTSSTTQNSETENYQDDSITSLSSQEQQPQSQSQQHNSHNHRHYHQQQQHNLSSPRSKSSSSSSNRKRLKDGVIRQREFPPWIKNRDYVDDYCSPTTTLLERINFFDNIRSNSTSPPRTLSPNSLNSNDVAEQLPPMTPASTLNNNNGGQQQPKKVPSVYEIFQLDKDGQPIKTSKSLDQNFEKSMIVDGHDQKQQSKQQQQPQHTNFGSNDTVIEFKSSSNSTNNNDNDDSLVIISKL